MSPISPILSIVIGDSLRLAGACCLVAAASPWWSHPWTLRDWTQHVFVLGTTGSGKSVLARNLAVKAIKAGAGMVYLCPKGSSRTMLRNIPPEHVNRVIWIAPYGHRIVGINVMKRYTDSPDERQRIAGDVVSIFQKLYYRSWGDNIAAIFRLSCLAVLEYSDKTGEEITLIDVYRFLRDLEFREAVRGHIDNAIVEQFLEAFKDKEAQKTINKLEGPLSNDAFAAMFGQKDGLDLHQALEQKKLILVDLDHEHLGESTAALFGSIILSAVYHAASRRNESSPPTLFLADEFHTYAGHHEDLATMLEVFRAKNIMLMLVCQHLAPLSDRVRNACFLARTQYILRPTVADVPFLAKQFVDRYESRDFYNLPSHFAIARELIGGRDRISRFHTSRPAKEYNHPPLPPQGRYRYDVLKEIRESFRRDSPHGEHGGHGEYGRLQVL